MKRILFPIVAVLLLLVGSMGAINLATAAPEAQATATRTPRATTEATEEATAEATEEATAEATEEATAEATEEATPEATEEATPEATEEADDESEDEAGDEADDEADAESDDEADTEGVAVPISETIGITGSVFPAFPAADNLDDNRTLTVVGVGRVLTAPGSATISLGIETANSDVSEATSENEDIIAAIIDAVEELGIDRENIQTNNLSVYLDAGERGLESGGDFTYRVSQQVTVTVRDLQGDPELLGDLVGAAVDAGANSVYGPNFQIVETRELQQQARTLAMEDALARAEDYAALAGVELGGVARIVEGSMANTPVLFDTGESAAVADQGGGIGSSIEGGLLVYDSSIQVAFYIGDAAPAAGDDESAEGSEAEDVESTDDAGTESESDVDEDAGAEGEDDADADTEGADTDNDESSESDSE